MSSSQVLAGPSWKPWHYYKEKYEALLAEMVLHSWELMEAMAKIKELTVFGHKKIH